MSDALTAVLPLLRCPVCGRPLERDGAVRCPQGHAFDVARQGYLNLQVGAATHRGDTAAMVAARSRFLGSAHYAPIGAAVADAVTRFAGSGALLDLAAGTGWYAARVLDADVGRAGLALDVSTAALRRAARAHPRLAAVGADAWSRLPLADAGFDVVLSVFGPRNVRELRRILAPGGVAVVVVPTPRHLAEIRAPLGMLEPAADKAAAIRAGFDALQLLAATTVEVTLRLGAADLADVVGMGPAGHHGTTDEIVQRVTAHLAGRTAVSVTASVEVLAWRQA